MKNRKFLIGLVMTIFCIIGFANLNSKAVHASYSNQSTFIKSQLVTMKLKIILNMSVNLIRGTNFGYLAGSWAQEVAGWLLTAINTIQVDVHFSLLIIHTAIVQTGTNALDKNRALEIIFEGFLNHKTPNSNYRIRGFIIAVE